MHKIKFLNGKYKEFETLSGANLKGADLRYYELIGANLRFSDLRGANLRESYLRGADLKDADLKGACLRGTDLRGTDLRGADLNGADLFDTSILSFQLGKHFAFYHEGYLQIGCQGYPLSYWLRNTVKIGKDNDYNESQIVIYRKQIELISELVKQGEIK